MARIDADRDASAVWPDVIAALTVRIVAVSALLDPGVIVVGGRCVARRACAPEAFAA